MSKWISVFDELPGDICDVLIFEDDGYSIGLAFYSSGGDFTDLQGGSVWSSVTHWMSLPDAPEVE
jgi:hypothetical protein